MAWLPPKREVRDDQGWTSWETGDDCLGPTSRALNLVPFFAAVRHIVDFLSTLPVDGYRVEGGARVPRSTPALLRRLNEVGDQGVQSWIGQWAYGLAVHGNSVGWVTTVDGFGFPIGVRWIGRSDWSYDESTRQWFVFGHPAPRERIVHSGWIVPPGKTLGLSPVDNFASFFKAGKAAQDYADVTRGGGLPPATLRNTAKTIEPTAAGLIQDRAVRAFATGKPFVSGNDWELKINDIPPNQLRFLDTLQLTANNTAAIFGIDPREIGGAATESLTYANDESRSLNRANNMRPYLERFEFMVSRLLPERQFIKLNVGATIRTDIKTRFEVYEIERRIGTRSVNEIRRLEDREDIGPEGDSYEPLRSTTPPPAQAGTTNSGGTP